MTSIVNKVSKNFDTLGLEFGKKLSCRHLRLITNAYINLIFSVKSKSSFTNYLYPTMTFTSRPIISVDLRWLSPHTISTFLQWSLSNAEVTCRTSFSAT